MRRRLDTELVRRRLAASRTDAAAAIREGRVMVAGRPALKAATLVAPDEPVVIEPGGDAFVSRGGVKLDAALDRFDLDVAERCCLDAGASTGGFTDCLLRRGAAAVLAVDVGYGQLAWAIRNDPRVTVLERTNVRELRADELPYRPDVVVADLSFISLRSALPALVSLAGGPADLVLLVKPQFEAGRGDVGKGGVVRDPDVWRRVLAEVAQASRDQGLVPRAAMASPILGPAGNAEFFLHAGRVSAIANGAAPAPAPAALDLDAAILEATRMREAS
ncbi:MAG: TlyA family RNA methyltransferase [Actinomycetota bacterium]